jgi:hypothetical protein
MIEKSMAADLKEKGVIVAMLHPDMVATPGSRAKATPAQIIEPQKAPEKCWALLLKTEIKNTEKF